MACLKSQQALPQYTIEQPLTQQLNSQYCLFSSYLKIADSSFILCCSNQQLFLLPCSQTQAGRTSLHVHSKQPLLHSRSKSIQQLLPLFCSLRCSTTPPPPPLTGRCCLQQAHSRGRPLPLHLPAAGAPPPPDQAPPAVGHLLRRIRPPLLRRAQPPMPRPSLSSRLCRWSSSPS